MFYFLGIAVLMFLALIVQCFTGQVPMFGGKILLMQLVFLYGAAALPLWGMLALAAMAGVMWDATILHNIDGHREMAFGWSILLYSGLGSIMNGLRPLFLRGIWVVHCIVAGLLASFGVLIEFLIITFRRDPLVLYFPKEVWMRILGSGIGVIVMAIPLFFILNWIASWAGYLKPERNVN